MNQQQIEAAREWIADCSWGDLDESDVRELSAEQVARGVATHYSGGIAQFIADQQD